MIFKKIVFLSLSALFFSGVANAACDVHTKNVTGEKFQYTYNCTNSHKNVKYQIIRHLTNKIDFEFFTFDPRGWNLLCSKISIEDQIIEQSCLQLGIGKPESYLTKDMSFELNLAVEAQKVSTFLESQNNFVFVYPKNSSQYIDVNCAIFATSETLSVYTPSDQITEIGECLLQYENYMSD